MNEPRTAAAFRIREARPEDAGTIVELIRELARYEKLEEHAKATPEGLVRHLFGPRPYAEVLIAEADGHGPVGCALFFHTFSTFRCQPGIYLEDIYVQPAVRGLGIGKALLASVAKLAVERDCGRVEWSVLNWNEPAIGFYKGLGAGPQDEWTMYRIDDERLARLAEQAPGLSREGAAS